MYFARKIVPNLIKKSFNIGFKTTLPRLSLRRTIQYAFSTNNNTQFDKFKQNSKEFYDKQVQKIHELKSIEDWKVLVEQSQEPVVIDFYADWCQPCKKLTPLLQRQATKDNNWRLVKINIDNFPQIANQLKIKAVPTVLLIANQQFIDAFSGYPDQTTLTRFLDNLKKGLDQGFLDNTKKQNQQMKLLEKARIALTENKYQQCQVSITNLLKTDLLQGLQPISYLMLAHSYVEQKKLSKYQQAIQTFRSKFSPLIESTQEAYGFIKQYLKQLDDLYQQKKIAPTQNQQITKLKNSLQSDPNNLQTKYELAIQLSKNSLEQQALILLLEIVKSNKNWENKKANNLMLEIFKALGTSDERTVKYRKLYQRLLY